MINDRIHLMLKLKDYFIENNEDFKEITSLSERNNAWFTQEFIEKSIDNICNQYLDENEMIVFASYIKTKEQLNNQITVGITMAGNIPLVGFHDFLCVLLSGNIAVTKLSSDDNTLLPALAEQLIQYAPTLKERIQFSFGKLGEIDAIIATGSDNSTKYFEQYFGHYPHLFRKNRTSIAVLTGNETKEELIALGKDIFSYFGLGCRNVSHLLIPKGFDLNRFFEAIVDYHPIVNHHKYANNYDYNKAVYLMNLMELLDNNFMLLRESEELFSPLSMVHYQYYTTNDEVETYLSTNKENIQATVGHQFIPFGEAQAPKLDDYADGVDVMKWLNSIDK